MLDQTNELRDIFSGTSAHTNARGVLEPRILYLVRKAILDLTSRLPSETSHLGPWGVRKWLKLEAKEWETS